MGPSFSPLSTTDPCSCASDFPLWGFPPTSINYCSSFLLTTLMLDAESNKYEKVIIYLCPHPPIRTYFGPHNGVVIIYTHTPWSPFNTTNLSVCEKKSNWMSAVKFDIFPRSYALQGNYIGCFHCHWSLDQPLSVARINIPSPDMDIPRGTWMFNVRGSAEHSFLSFSTNNINILIEYTLAKNSAQWHYWV